MAFNNPWGKGSGEHDKWFKNIWENQDLLGTSNPDDSDGAGDDTQSLYKLFHTPDEIFIDDRNDIKVYIDPGHRYGSAGDQGNRGAESTSGYKHHVPETVDGNQVPKKENDEVVVETHSWQDVDTKSELKYVKDEVTLGHSSWNWTTEWVHDGTRPEHRVVYEIGAMVYELLIQLGYSAVISRDATGGPLLRERITAANKLPADYYIAIHSDGDTQLRYNFEECFAIYYPDTDNSTRQSVFAQDMMHFYTYSTGNTGAQISRDSQTGLPSSRAYGITDPSQSFSTRRTILEIGNTENPKWYDQAIASKREIAKQLVLGLEQNIARCYYKKGKLVGYQYEGVVYKTKDEIPYPSRGNSTPQPKPYFPQIPALKNPSLLPPPTWDEVKKTKTIYEKLPLPKINIDAALNKIPIT